jgi:hypothetical protein
MSIRPRGTGVVEMELADGPPRPPAGDGGPTYILLRWQGHPVGRVVLDGGQVPAAADFARLVLEAAAPSWLNEGFLPTFA